MICGVRVALFIEGESNVPTVYFSDPDFRLEVQDNLCRESCYKNVFLNQDVAN